MARLIKTLEAIVDDVRRETGRSVNRNFGQTDFDKIKYLVQREQRRLWLDHDWSFLKIRADKVLVPGDRYYDMPAGISMERVLRARVKYDAEWQDLTRGITEEDYSLFDSDDDVRQDPPEKWDIISTNATGAITAQIEIWPMPSVARTTRWTGVRECAVFVAENDICTLDAQLLALSAAAIMKPDSQEIIAAANQMYKNMKADDSRKTPDNKFNMAGGGSQGGGKGKTRIIAVRG